MARSILYTVIGNDYYAVDDWHRAFPDRPFVGIRVEGTGISVVFEPRTANGPLDAGLVRRIRHLFDEKESHETGTGDQVFIYMAPTLRAAHRFAKRLFHACHGDAA